MFLYHPCNANIVTDALGKLSMGNDAVVKDVKKEIAYSVDILENSIGWLS